jgi:hypothetical protein
VSKVFRLVRNNEKVRDVSGGNIVVDANGCKGQEVEGDSMWVEEVGGLQSEERVNWWCERVFSW